MAHVLGQPILLVQRLTSGGSPASGLLDADFPLGTLQLRRIEVGGPSPAAISLAGGVDFTVEETWALSGVYALKLTATAVPAAGTYVIRIGNGPGAIDELTGVMVVNTHDPDAEALWLNGKNTVGITTGYDTYGNPTAVNVYGFDSAADAELFAGDPSAHGALVRYLINESYLYEPSTGRPTKYVRRVP